MQRGETRRPRAGLPGRFAAAPGKTQTVGKYDRLMLTAHAREPGVATAQCLGSGARVSAGALDTVHVVRRRNAGHFAEIAGDLATHTPGLLVTVRGLRRILCLHPRAPGMKGRCMLQIVRAVHTAE